MNLSRRFALAHLGIFVGCLTGARPVLADGVQGHINECVQNSNDFTVKLKYDGVPTWYEALCIRSYARCPFSDQSCLGGKDDWTAESGESFDYLESRVYYVSDDSSPKWLYVNDDTGTNGCARAFHKNDYQDFIMGDSLDVSKWWDKNPAHLTIIPFNESSGSCDTATDVVFDASRSLAVWLTPYEGQSSDPGDGSVWCDISLNPETCLNEPFWGVEGDNLALYGPLTNVLGNNPSGVSIYIPEGYDTDLSINNNIIYFSISNGYQSSCSKFLNDGVSACKVDSFWIASYYTDAKITVSGLGNINGWNALNGQRDNGYHDFKVGSGSDFHGVKAFGEWQMSALLLSLASVSSGSTDGFAIDVSGVEVAWGSRLGWSPIEFNSPWASDIFHDTSSHPVKMYDLKYVGNWNDQADGPDIMGEKSMSSYTYTHTNDDNLKVAAPNTYRKHATLLQGNAGCAINLGSYGNDPNSNIDNSQVNGIYMHRIVHNSRGYQGCGSTGGMICTRSCGENSNGLIDTTVWNLYVPELGANNNGGANSVSVPFGIGVDAGSVFCGGGPTGDYPIRNLIFKDMNIWTEPACKSRMYDTSGKVQWGAGSDWPSVTFFDTATSDSSQCDFQGTVEFYHDPQYFVCGYPDEGDANSFCLSNGAIGGEPNVDYSEITNGANPNISFPSCGSPQGKTIAID